MRTRHPPTRVSIVLAAHPGLRARCANILKNKKGINIVRSVESPAEILKAVIQLTPDIVLIEEALVRNVRRALLANLKRLSPSTKAILLCVDMNAAVILGALTDHARGCLNPHEASAHLVNSIHTVQRGELWIPRAVLTLAAKRLAERSRRSV